MLAQVAVADQHKVQRLVARQGSGVEQGVERVGLAHRAGIADHRVARRARGIERLLHVGSQRLRRGLPIVGRDAVGHDREPGQVQPVRGHVCVHLGQHRHHQVGMAIGTVLGPLAQQRERVPLRHARQLDRRQRPQVVHLVHQRRAGQPRDAPRRPAVHRVGARTDDHVGPERRHELRRQGPHLAQERGDVAQAAQAVAAVGAAWPASDRRCRRALARPPRVGASARAKSWQPGSARGALREPTRGPGSTGGTPCRAPGCRRSG